MKNSFLAIIVLALCSLSFAGNAAANHHKFTVLHVFEGSPDGEASEAPLVRDAAGNLYGTTTGGGNDNGTIFKVDANGHESILFSFNGSDGGFPTSGLTLDAAGNLYGVAEEGPGGAGVLFRLDPSGKQTVLHVFQGGFNSEPKGPVGSLIMDEAGNLYGVTEGGGHGLFPGFGTIYRLDPAGKFSVLYEFRGKADGSNPQGPLVRDARGNLYGVATSVDSGGAIPGTVFKLAPGGKFTVLHTFTGGADGGGPQAGLLMDNAGNLFGTAATGGDSGDGTVFEITSHRKFTRLYSFTGAADGRSPNGGLVQDPDGNLYGTTQIGPRKFFLGTVFELSPAHTLTVLHSFKGLNDGAVPLAGLIRDNAGNLYGTTVKNFLIQHVQGGGVFQIRP